MSVQIVEIMGRSTQGITRPFKCRGDDGHIYFVKGHGAGRRSQICEWIAGQLALRLGLPIAPFEIVDVPEELMQLDFSGELQDLGVGLAFGSRKLSVVELSISHLDHVPDEVKRDVLAFDWWVQNADRTLSALGGNPNLFWDIETQKLVVIDHNQAFDRNFPPSEFAELHVFFAEWRDLAGDWDRQQKLASRFEAAMADWTAICNTVPPEWWFLDSEQTVRTDFDLDVTRQLLMEFQTPTFWRLT
jgi:hypothetical protein